MMRGWMRIVTTVRRNRPIESSCDVITPKNLEEGD